MDNARRGTIALEASNFELAIDEFTKALIEHPTSPDYFTQRSIAYARSKPPRHHLALKDAEYALICAKKREKREKMQKAQQRRAVALYGLGQYANAKFILEKMEKWRKKENKSDWMDGQMWTAKVERKLKDGGEEMSTTVTVEEYPSGLTLPTVEELKEQSGTTGKSEDVSGQAAKSQAGKDTVLKGANTIDNTQHTTNGDHSSDAMAVDAPQPKAMPVIRHEWYQNAQIVTVTFYAKGVSKDKVNVDLQENNVSPRTIPGPTQLTSAKLSVSFPDPSTPSSDYQFTVPSLYADIDPKQSKHRVLSTKVEVTLRKKVEAQKWSTLETSTDRPAISTLNNDSIPTMTSTATAEKAPSYPTSSRTGPKNWDKLASDLTAKKPKPTPKPKSDSKKPSDPSDETDATSDTPTPPAEEDYDSEYEGSGGDPVDGFFKKLYAGADDDTKRAMMKSFQESGGTALSTNWEEVGKKKVEVVRSKDDD